MGISLMGHSTRRNPLPYTKPIVAPDPDPFKFEILREEIVNGKSILLVKYHGCTTFSGCKLMLLKRKWDHRKKVLDPHFLDNHIVLARFEPTEAGWVLARLCAKVKIL